MRYQLNRNKIILATILWIPLFTSAQVNRYLDDLVERQFSMEASLRSISQQVTPMKGNHMYLTRSWQNACVVTHEGTYLYFNGKFNVLTQMVELFLDSGLYALRPQEVVAITLGQWLLVPVHEKGNWVYYEVLEKGEINLLKRYFLDSKMESGNSLVPGVNGEKKYYIEGKLFYTYDFTTVEDLKTGKRKVLGLFGSRSSQVEAYLDEENIRLKDEQDLIRLFRYFNSL